MLQVSFRAVLCPFAHQDTQVVNSWGRPGKPQLSQLRDNVLVRDIRLILAKVDDLAQLCLHNKLLD